MTPSRATLFVLRAAVILFCALHALFSPVYEGPDEPFHLARARQFTRAPLAEAIPGQVVDADLVRSVTAWPCGPSLQAAFACPAFGSEPAAFNLLEPARRADASLSRTNYQAHQPPLYYLTAAALLKLLAPGIGTAPEAQILLLRLAALLLVAYVLCFPWRKLGKGNAHLETFLLVVLLLPGAVESLIRVSNDVAVFAWAVLMVAALSRTMGIRTRELAWLAALGPLLKLTAFPIVAVAAAVGWRARGWRSGLPIAASGLAVIPLQWLRGWAWGGTLEANTSFGSLGSWPEILTGLAHSAATFLKTGVWLGGWTFFRPPAWVLVAVPLVGLGVLVRCVRLRRPVLHRHAHLAGAAIAAAGFIAFALGQRQLFGVWGGVGGWYLWGWTPWLALLASNLFEVRSGRERECAYTLVATAVILHAVWFAVAVQTYGV